MSQGGCKGRGWDGVGKGREGDGEGRGRRREFHLFCFFFCFFCFVFFARTRLSRSGSSVRSSTVASRPAGSSIATATGTGAVTSDTRAHQPPRCHLPRAHRYGSYASLVEAVAEKLRREGHVVPKAVRALLLHVPIAPPTSTFEKEKEKTYSKKENLRCEAATFETVESSGAESVLVTVSQAAFFASRTVQMYKRTRTSRVRKRFSDELARLARARDCRPRAALRAPLACAPGNFRNFSFSPQFGNFCTNFRACVCLNPIAVTGWCRVATLVR